MRFFALNEDERVQRTRAQAKAALELGALLRLQRREPKVRRPVALDDEINGGVTEVADAVEQDDRAGRFVVAQGTCSIGAPAAFQPLNPVSRWATLV